jgi:hypothetical protein
VSTPNDTAPEQGQRIYRASYQPPPDKPPFFDARLAQIGGRLLNGDPKLRVVWGCDARGFPWPDNQQLKYICPDDPEAGWACWILEQFVTSDFFGDPGEWERNRWRWQDGRNVEVMAPFPSGGEYVFVMQLATPDGETFPLGDQALTFIEWLVASHHTTPHNGYTQQKFIGERLDKIKAAQAERSRASDERLAAIYDAATRQDELNRTGGRLYGRGLLHDLPGARPAARRILTPKESE